MMTMTKTSLTLLLCMITASCTVIQKQPGTKPVRLIFYNELNVVTDKKQPECRYLGEIVGSEGRWYTYLFIHNSDLTHGAMNDIHNKANQLGANVVYLNDQIPFTTSVTFYGQAYHCDYDQ